MPFFFCSQSHSPFSTPQAATRCCRIVFHAGSPAERQLFRTDFRFAPSPHRASLAGPPIHEDMVVHGLCGRVPDSAGNACSLNCRCSDIANLSAHLHRLPTPPPYLRQMRLSHGRGRRYRVANDAAAWSGRRCWMLDMPATWPVRRSSKSPRTLPKCKCLITKQLTFIAVRGGINLSSPSTVLKVNYLFISYLCF